MSRAFDLDRQSKECWNSGLQRRAQQEQVIHLYNVIQVSHLQRESSSESMEKIGKVLFWFGVTRT